MAISKLKASSISSGTIDNARISLDAAEIPALPTSKITSGTFDDARIASSNVSQHATSFDDNKLVNDLSTLGLRVHTQENLAASNTNSQYVDVFQDGTGIASNTNAPRNTNEYHSTILSTPDSVELLGNMVILVGVGVVQLGQEVVMIICFMLVVIIIQHKWLIII